MGWKRHNLRRYEDAGGIGYKEELFVHNADRATYAPVVGTLATWAPTTAYVTDFEAKPTGPHWNYDITAKSVQNVNRHYSDKGVYYSCVFYTSKAAIEAGGLPIFGTEVDWAPVDAGSNKPYVFDVQTTMMGDTYYYVTIKACEAKYELGVE